MLGITATQYAKRWAGALRNVVLPLVIALEDEISKLLARG
jgi:hypothetical protein